MERTESKVVQIAPAHENALIRDMEKFGYNLQSRQEIHETGDSLALPNLYGGSTKHTKIRQYVKVHFVRSLEMKNLDQLRELESQYFGTELPSVKSWPLVVSAILTLGGLNALISHGNIFAFVIFGVPGGFWLYKSIQKRKVAKEMLAEVQMQRNKLIQSAEALLEC
jgi:hypothetical protein